MLPLLLILEKEKDWRDFYFNTFQKHYEIRFISEIKAAYSELKKYHFNLVFTDLQGGEKKTLELVRWISSNQPDVPVIVTGDSEKTELVVHAIKSGAFDFLPKPFSAQKALLVAQKALNDRSQKNEIDYLRRTQDTIYNFDQIIAVSPGMKEIVKTLKKFSTTDATILIRGETGTGKSFLSGTIHFNSKRKRKPFIKINCANIPETLLESELFGHEKGAFTGADKLRVGRFEQAHGGTLFLDEIGEMSLDLQAKLLRVLEDKSFERVGGDQTIHSDVRVIAATNRNIENQIKEKKFREDLYYRINVLSITLPPLRKRSECLIHLANFLLEKTCRSIPKKLIEFSPSVIESIKHYEWPGNIRELANTIERAVILEESEIITKKTFSIPQPISQEKDQKSKKLADRISMDEKEIIIETLDECLWIQKDAARRLGVSPRSLNYKIKKFGITHPRWRKNR